MITLKLRKIGNSVGVILPKKVLDVLQLTQGDSVFLNDSAEGYWLTSTNSKPAAQIKLSKKIMHRRKKALQDLAR
jgi:putative addiction module antidote